MADEVPQEVVDLCNHLKGTGTGDAKLEALKALAKSCDNPDQFLECLADVVPPATIAKINAYLETKAPKKPVKKAAAPEDGKEPVEETSEVVNMNATDAADSISRMHSVEKLQHIVATDTRVTVQRAATARLEELAKAAESK